MSGAGVVVSEHADRVVIEHPDRYEKRFLRVRDRDRELANLGALAALGIAVPEVLDTGGSHLVTAPLPGEPLDRLVARAWSTTPRAERNRILRAVGDVARRLRDGGYAWPDLVSYHLFWDGARMAVLDPARLRRGRLDLTPLYYSADEPTVSRTDRLRVWRAAAGDAPPPRLRRIGHRGRFRPYRWVHQRGPVRPLPRWKEPFVAGAAVEWTSADALAADPRLEVKRALPDRTNARLAGLHVKITRDPGEARREWEHHRVLMAAGFRVPQPAVAGVLRDGRGLFATVDLAGHFPMDDVWERLDRRAAVRACADLARRLHAGGLVHRDLYLCHLFVDPAQAGPRPVLLDLARLTRTTSRRLRVKDLAALVHSARGLWTRADVARLVRRYGGDRRLWRRVLRKADRIARHVPRNVKDGTHVPHRPDPACTSV